MVPSAGVHEPQRLFWLATQRIEVGLRPAVEVARRTARAARASSASSVGRRRRSALVTRSTMVVTHSRSSALVIRAGIITTIVSPSR